MGRGAGTEICQATYVQSDIAGASHYWGGGCWVGESFNAQSLEALKVLRQHR